MSLLKGLNPSQAQAVTSPSETILCLAGAGSGKTTVLTGRVANLHLNHRVGTSNMLCLTFTRLAGKEMKERIMRIIGEAEGKKLFVNTFHAFAVSVLQEWGWKIGIDKNFTIYDQADRQTVLEGIIDDFGSRTNIKKVTWALEKNVPRENINYFEEFRVIDEYEFRLRQNNSVDLDRLISLVNKLWEKHPDSLAYYRQRYSHVFVDEFQDTSDDQMKMIKTLASEHLFVVGDDFQAIYGWRGARVEYIIQFSQYQSCEVIKLEDNYRSTKTIVNAANNLISHNTRQTKKTLRAHKEGKNVHLHTVADERLEPDLLAVKVKQMVSAGRKYRDIAILARTNRQIERIKNRFSEEGIPSTKVGGDDIFKKNDIKALIAWLDVIANEKDGISLKKSLTFPTPFVTELERQQIEMNALQEDITILESMKNYRDKFSGVDRFLETIEVVKRTWDNPYPDESGASSQFETLVLELELFQLYESKGLNNRVQDLKDALQYTLSWQKSKSALGEPDDIYAFLKWLKYRDIQEKLVEEKDRVKLMTIHASKGLEFPVVFLVGMNEGVFPSRNSNDLEEERRLAYVAITRAKEELIITRPDKTFNWKNQLVPAAQSQFINELQGDGDP